jgi:hypothetical protein
MPMPYCDVCGGAAVSVVCSSVGAISLAYCQRCADEGSEPFGLLAGSLGATGITCRAEAAEWLIETIEVTCLRAQKTEAQFWAEAQRMNDLIMNDPELQGPDPDLPPAYQQEVKEVAAEWAVVDGDGIEPDPTGSKED